MFKSINEYLRSRRKERQENIDFLISLLVDYHNTNKRPLGFFICYKCGKLKKVRWLGTYFFPRENELGFLCNSCCDKEEVLCDLEPFVLNVYRNLRRLEKDQILLSKINSELRHIKFQREAKQKNSKRDF